MANTRELRRRIKSVKNTAQITKAMQMVAATKMRRAQNQALSGRPYSDNLNSILDQLIPRIEQGTHPLLRENSAGKVGVLLISTDKGLCGALNTNIFRVATNLIKENKDADFYTLGKKGRQFIVKMGQNLIADFENSDTVTFRQATQIAKLAITAFLKSEIKEFHIIYPDFVSTLRQEARVIKLLPVDFVELSKVLTSSLENKSDKQPNTTTNEVLFEPNVDSLLDYILTHFVETKIYQALLETKASEHSARMMAMQNATDNAKELVGDLTLNYNQTRQQGITNELLEITSAQAALE